MSVPADKFQYLYDDNQKTSAIGYPPYMAVTQGGNWDKTLNAVVQLATSFGTDGTIQDARDKAFTSIAALPAWSKGEASGVHAEVLIIRAWLVIELSKPHTNVQQAIAALQHRTIVASQPACWCCYQLMVDWGINIGDGTIGKKPLSGWRHPLAKRTVPNADIPKTRGEVTKDWIAKAGSFND